MKLWDDDGMRTMFSIFDQHTLKGKIELDISLVRILSNISGVFNLALDLRRNQDLQ